MRRRLTRKAGSVKGAIEPITAAITRKHASRAIATVCGGSKPHDEQAGTPVAEVRHRAAPIIPIAKGTTLLGGDALTIVAQPRTKFALYDLPIQLIPGHL